MPGGALNSAENSGVSARGEFLFDGHIRAIRVQTDHLFVGLMIFQWLLGMALALLISPRAWAGAQSSVHFHVWLAIFGGGLISGFPIFLALRQPGEVLTRQVVAVAQMLTSVLLIHLTGGRIETHFHVFGSLAFLAFYRDWRVLATATLVVALDHFVRGIYWPLSAFGVLTASPWRALEHAGWVIFEDVFLLMSIRRGLFEKHIVAQRQAELEDLNARIEHIVEERSAELRDEISEHKRTGAALSETSRLLEMLFENTPDFIYFKDRESRFVYFSKSFQKYFQLEDFASLKGKTAFDLWPPEQARAFLEDDRQIIRTGLPIIGKATKTTRADGVVTWFLMTKMPWRDDAGNIIGIFGISTDVTTLQNAQAEQQMLEAQLQQAHKLEAIGQLAAGIAHEINTPMQFIGDNVRFVGDSFGELRPLLDAPRRLLEAMRNSGVTPELLRSTEKILQTADADYLSAEIPKALAETLQGLEHVSKIVRAMKEFSHPGTTEKTPVDLNHAIDSTLTVARNEWKYVAEMETDFDAALPPVWCVPGEFNQVILNLVVNAAHAINDVVKNRAAEKGTIKVSTRHAGAWAEVRVRDTGGGIPETVRHKIFDPFFTTKEVGKGTGQGLAIARSVVVDKHGGTIDFASEMGCGTEFLVRIPLEAAA